MKVLNLRCTNEHRFEGWFASEDDFQSQFERALVECPMCGDKSISRLPTAPHLSMAKARDPQAPAAPVAASAPAGFRSASSSRLSAPTPCSAEIEPPCAVTAS